MSSDDTRTRIMDVAEQLFSLRGYDGVSVSEITSTAKLQKSIISYHFGSKLGLWEAVFSRRVEALGAERLRLLGECENAPGGATVRGLIEAFLTPFFDLCRNQEAQAYARLVAQTSNAAHPQAIEALKLFNPIAKRFVAAFQRLLPEASEAAVVHGFNFFLGSMMLGLARTERVEGLSEGRVSGSDLDALYLYMVAFASAGMQALNDSDPVAKT